jgi:hypothetical protein
MVRSATALASVAALLAGAAIADPVASPAASTEAGLRRLGAPATAAPTPPSAAPLAGSDPRPRLYSLHRDYGETPDRTVLPPEFFLAPASTDLAEPPPPPARDRAGRVVPDTPQS